MKISEAYRIIRDAVNAEKRNAEIVKALYKNLSEYTDFDLGETGETYRFTRCKALSDMFAEYSLREIAGNGDTMSKARRIMQWIDDNSVYNGASPLPPSLPDKILEFGFKQHDPINCANRAILFSDALTSIGVFAMPVWLQNQADGCGHCHVIAQVWLPECRKWQAFDPSFNTFFTYKGNPIDVPSLALVSRGKKKCRIISNRTGKTTKTGYECAKIGFVDISIFPGNDLKYRHDWDSCLHFVPDSYKKENLKPGVKTIGLLSLNKEPVWEDA